MLSLATCFTAKADNGKALEVHTVFGKLAGKAVAKGGKATVNAASLTNGVYVIKAEGQALKMKKIKVLFHSTFSRHGKAQASLALLIWLNENVPNHTLSY